MKTKVEFTDYELQKNKKVDFINIIFKHKDHWIFPITDGYKELFIEKIESNLSLDKILNVKKHIKNKFNISEFKVFPLEYFQIYNTSQQVEESGLLFFAELFSLPQNMKSNYYQTQNPVKQKFSLVEKKLIERVILKTQIILKTQNYKHIIWDWNGTLIDDVEVTLSAVQTLLHENNLPTVDIHRYRDLFGFPIKDYYLKLGFNLESHCFKTLSHRFHEEYDKNRLLAGNLFSDVIHHLDFFSETKGQSILSAGAQWFLNDWVRHYNISHFFDHIYGIDNLHATSKVGRGHELMKISGYTPSETILIGDTDHDLEVGKELGVEVLLVANGHQSYERLAKVHDNVIERV